MKTAPGQEDLLDIPADAYEPLRQQAEKFSTAELGRFIALLLAAQNDMRWTTSPRITLELALVRACVPETDPTPAGVVARLERLERLANLSPGAAIPDHGAAGTPAPVAEEQAAEEQAAGRPPAAQAPVTHVASPPELPTTDEVVTTRPATEPPAEPAAAGADGAPAQQMPVPHAADAGSVDVIMLRRSWASLLDHLGQMARPQPVLRALLEPATPASFDGSTLELAFPPSGGFGVQRVMDRQDVLRQALNDLFGVSPQIVCVVRESREPASEHVVELVDDDEAPDEAEALRRVQEMLGATPVGEIEE